MDGSLANAPASSDRSITAEISGIARDNHGGLVCHGETPRRDPRVVDSIPTEWTDEKHSLYLSSIEASFVNQLYSSEYQSKDLLGWLSRTQKHRNSSGSNSKSVFSGQFKVLRGGCWEKRNFERARSRVDIHNESHLLSQSPWIQHFRSPSKGKELNLTSGNRLDSNVKSINLGGERHEIEDCGEATSSKQLRVSWTPIYHQDSVGSSTEVSDQNFVDEFEGGEQLSTTCRKRRLRTAVANASVKDQVVPSREFAVAPSSSENCASLKGMMHNVAAGD